MKTIKHKFIIFSLIFGLGLSFANIALAQENSGLLESRPLSLTGNLPSIVGNIISSAVSDGGPAVLADPSFWVDKVAKNTFAWGATQIMQLASFLTGLAGMILNGVVHYTIVDVSSNYSKIPAIDETWGVVRDVANMGFIFFLLYAAIMTILGSGGDNKTLIVRTVIAAILVNFSMFFTKLLIDAGNILALLFYEAIVGPNPFQQGATIFGSETLGSVTSNASLAFGGHGLSNILMQNLSLTQLYDVAGGSLGVDSIITVSVMGTILLLIAAFVFFAISLMFIIRYVALIFVIIFSPIAFLAMVFPEADKYAKQWREAWIGQTFFAPIYFFLTWVMLRVLGGVMEGLKTKSNISTVTINEAGSTLARTFSDSSNLAKDPGSLAMFIGFIIVIAFLIASLTISKEWASRLPGGAGKLMGWATGVAGGATLGMAGRLGRQTVGRAAQVYLGENDGLKEMAKSKNVFKSTFAKAGLKTGRKVGETSWDLRSSPIGDQFGAGKGVKGFSGYRKDKDEAEEKFAKSLGASDKTKAKTSEALKNAEEAEQRKRQEVTENIDRELTRPPRPNTADIDRQIEDRNKIINEDLYPEADRERAQSEKAELERQKSELLQNFETKLATYESERGRRINELVANSEEGQALKSAQERHAEVHGVKVDDAKKKLNTQQESREKLEENSPLFKEQERLTKAVSDLTNELSTATGARKEEVQRDLEMRQKELELNSKEIAVRKKVIKDEFDKLRGTVEKKASSGDRRKAEYADALENSLWAKTWGYNYTSAAKIRKGESTKDKAAKVLKDLAKESGVDIEENKEEEPKTPPANTT